MWRAIVPFGRNGETQLNGTFGEIKAGQRGGKTELG